MTALESIAQAIAFVEDHLRSPVTVADMANAAGYSLYHFCRVFGKYTRHTPYDYLMRRRMALAAREVIATGRKIVDVALDYQFESHEGFTRAFQRMFGAAPAEARRQKGISACRVLPRLTEAHLVCLQRQNGLIPRFVSLPEMACPRADRLASPGATVRFAVPLLWPAADGPCLPGDLPAGEYAVFGLGGAGDDLALVLDWILHTWLFYAPYDLRLPDVLIQGGPQVSLCVPVQARHN